MSEKRMKFLNTHVDNLTMEEAVREAKRLILKGKNSYVVTPNVDHIVKIEHDGLFRDIYEKADLVLTDGKPLIWMSRWMGTPIKEKISGSDYFPEVCRMAAQEGFSVFLLGAAEGVAKKAAINLMKKYKNLKIAGVYSPSYAFENDVEEISYIIKKINAAKPDILCIGLGTPKQEKFYHRYKEQLKVPLTLHIGATIDFEAGVVKRAPKWISYVGLEWFYRLVKEPRRLYKRYLLEDVEIFPIFLKYRKYGSGSKVSAIQPETCSILGVDIAVTNMRSVIGYLTKNLERLRGEYVCVSNVHTTVMAYNDEAYCRIQNEAALAIPDGKPLSLMCRLRGYKDAQRVAGPDLMPEILKLSEEKGYRHYFYGSTEETLNSLEANLRERYPRLNIVGIYSPPFRKLTPEEDAEIMEKISLTKPDFLWVGLGAPKQERWMYEHKGKVDAVMLGVGAAFDFHAGTAKRAPKWIQEFYLEWLYRLIQDPKRLLKRYVRSNIQFIWLILTGR
ncbi:exopolysaccharide biosynthesis WecB/TagA/CpsF family protein [Kineothrix alysoides]|uniref:Exopolysaccharide biosynthesis WecB/TagA/CpsF family protein n=1 Tax=Kineothrix alysoides TaxID=1469948 RepID=A0A4R1R1V9_9FIRM|nr:WecB/TagA/CpsF family glycosyltransferase [Kineothrix alysoides]TCL59340.1 exopolysaccharide biosynthesis WecB/TagA/CpsF family protein [Kineothrix alysoides]